MTMPVETASPSPTAAPAAGGRLRLDRPTDVLPPLPHAIWGLILLLLGTFVALYQYNLRELSSVWGRDPNWSHGYLVPLLAAAFVYWEWDALRRTPVSPNWLGAGLMVYGIAGNVMFRVMGQTYLSHLSMVVTLLGLVLLVLGWGHLRYLWLPIGYLLFMINLPTALYVKLTAPLQSLAAEAGVRLLPFFGVEADRAGTILTVITREGPRELNVAEACSGIRMLIAFFALAVALGYSAPRPMWQKVTLALAALPIALACNALRVALTGVLYVYVGKDSAEGSTHENLGFFMLLPAMGLQLAVGWVLDRMFVEVPDAAETPKGAA